MLITQLFFFFLVLWYENVVGEKKLCTFEDAECLTNGAQKTYKEYVSGELEGVPSSDPLHVDLVEGNILTVNYTLRNITLYGMKNCNPELVKIKSKDMTYHYYIACSHLNMYGQYEINGKVGTMDLEGHGDFKVDYYDYVLLFSGRFDKTFDDDKKLHIQIETFDFDINIRGNVTYDFNNLSNGNSDKSAVLHEYSSTDGKEKNEALRKPVMDKFMSIFIKNLNVYLKVVSFEDVFFR